MANDAYLKPGPLFPALPYSYYSTQHSAPGCCDSLPSLPGRYNPYSIPTAATFPGTCTPRRPTPISDLFPYDLKPIQPAVPRSGIIDNMQQPMPGVGSSESSPVLFDKSSANSPYIPTFTSGMSPFGAMSGNFGRVEDPAGIPGTGSSASLLSGHNSYSPAPQDSAVNADTTSAPLSSLVNSTSTTTTNTYPWSFYYQGLPMTTPNSKLFSTAQHQAYSFDSPKVKLTSEVAVPLIEWFEEHRDHPYPSRQDKVTLCQLTGLTFTQVSTWFANARRRMKKHSLQDGTEVSLSPSEASNAERCKSRRLSSSEDCEVLSPE